jgi:hypothetical protein
MAFVGLFSLFIMFNVTGEGRLAFTHSQLSAVLHVLMPLVMGLCILAMVIFLPRFCLSRLIQSCTAPNLFILSTHVQPGRV